MDGNFGGTLEPRLLHADTVIPLDFSRFRCLYRIIKRWIQYRGRSRPDMASGCPEKMDWQFLNWVWSYPACERPSVLDKIAQNSTGKRIVILRNPREIRLFVESVVREHRTPIGK